MTSRDTVIVGTSLSRAIARGLPWLDARMVERTRPGTASSHRPVVHEVGRGTAAQSPPRVAASAA